MNKFFKTALITLLGISCATIAVAQDTAKSDSSVTFGGYALGNLTYSRQSDNTLMGTSTNKRGTYKKNEFYTTGKGRLIVTGTTKLDDWTTQGVLRFSGSSSSTSDSGVLIQRAYATASNKTVEILAGYDDITDISLGNDWLETASNSCGLKTPNTTEDGFQSCDYNAYSDFLFGTAAYVQVGYVALAQHKVYVLLGHGPKAMGSDVTKAGAPITVATDDTPYTQTTMGVKYEGNFDVTSTDKLAVNAAFYYGTTSVNDADKDAAVIASTKDDVKDPLKESTYDGSSAYQASAYANYQYNKLVGATLGLSFAGQSTGDKDIEKKDADGNASGFKKSQSILNLVASVDYTIDPKQGVSALFTYKSNTAAEYVDGDDSSEIQFGVGYKYDLSSKIKAVGFLKSDSYSLKHKVGDKDEKSNLSIGSGLEYAF